MNATSGKGIVTNILRAKELADGNIISDWDFIGPIALRGVCKAPR
jgi:hypothetical protein